MYEITGLDKFEKEFLRALEVKYPKEIKKKLIEIANELKSSVKNRTPVGSSRKHSSKRLKSRWKVGKVKKKNNGLFIEVRNTAPHAHLIEDGHRIVTKEGKVVGFVEGNHMLLISVKQLEEKLTPKLQAWLRNMLKEYEL